MLRLQLKPIIPQIVFKWHFEFRKLIYKYRVISIRSDADFFPIQYVSIAFTEFEVSWNLKFRSKSLCLNLSWNYSMNQFHPNPIQWNQKRPPLVYFKPCACNDPSRTFSFSRFQHRSRCFEFFPPHSYPNKKVCVFSSNSFQLLSPTSLFCTFN